MGKWADASRERYERTGMLRSLKNVLSIAVLFEQFKRLTIWFLQEQWELQKEDS
jgi:hypothetical protein